MKNSYKIPATKIPFLMLIFFELIFPLLGYIFFKFFGWDGWMGLIFLTALWLIPLYVIVKYFKFQKDNLIVDNSGLRLSFSGQKIEFGWEEVNKVGFQAITAKRMGAQEIFPYLAIELKNTSKIENLKSSPEFGFLQKRKDLGLYSDQKDVLDIYISMRFASEGDSGLLGFLSAKSPFIKELNPLVRVNHK